jgi:hypothetical protein
MSIGIGSSYSAYYTQTLNSSINNSDKTSISGTTDKSTKTASKDEYFNNLSSEYPNAQINMSDSYLFKKNDVTYNFSPKYIEKAMKDPKAAENVKRLLDEAPSFPQYLNTHKYTPDGREVSSVSFVVDENGGVSCKCEFKEKKSKDTDELSDVEKLRRKKLKELREGNSKITKQQQSYYNNSAKTSDITDINLLSTKM